MRQSVSVMMWTLVCLAMVGVASPPAYGQGAGTTTSLSGLVVDSSGGVMPGVDVVVKNNATAATYSATTDGNGRFTVPALNPGIYTVTVSLTGFKTVVLPDVQLTAATPASVKAVLELGKIEESVVVTGATEIVQTQSAAVQTTLVVQQIQQLPLVTRTALDYVVNMTGVSTTGTNSRGSTINGLPSVTINITLDGVNVQDNNNRNGDGFFMYIRPLMDSVEEITVSTSTPEAASTAGGAAQIRMVTRSGSNRFSGSVYSTWRNQAGTNDADVMARTKHPSWIWRLNTPYWYNKRDQPKTAAGDYFIDDVRLKTPGFRVGGPILKDKLFYFFNWEWFLWPNQVNRVRYLMNTTAQQGLFTYPTASGGVNRTVDLLAFMGTKGQTSTFDPTVAKLLADIRNATQGQGGLDYYDQNVDRYTYSPGGTQKRHFPTIRLDYNVTNAHRLTFTSRYNRFDSDPDILNSVEPRFPGFPNYAGQYSDRFMAQGTLRSTIGKNMVNEGRVGWSGAFGKGTLFFPELSDSQFNCTGVGCQQAGGQGWSLGINAFRGITTATASNGPSSRNTPSYVFEDTLTWLKGKHSFSMGGSYTITKTTNWNDTIVPTITFSTSSLDPAYNFLTTSALNAQGWDINDTWSGYARDLYAVLTGRVTSVGGTAYQFTDGNYYYNGERYNICSQNELGLFFSDSWRLRPNVTLNYGLRYELQFPFQPGASTYSRLQDWTQVYGITGPGNLFKPGTMTGADPLLVQYMKGDPGYNMDYNNIAPSVGVAWRPTLKPSFLTKIISTDPVIRGGYSISYSRYATNDFISAYGSNPGLSRTATRSTTAGTPLLGSDAVGAPQVFPVLLQQTNRLFPGQFPASPTYPVAPAVNEQVNVYDPKIGVPYTHQWSVGFQRELGKTMAIEIRYVGNLNVGGWTYWNLNGTSNWNILENGWYGEFQQAQKNLQANIAAGKGNTFAYTGATGTKPLPIFMAYFKGIPLTDARNQDPAQYAYTGSCNLTTNPVACFGSSSWYNSLAYYSPSLTGIAGTGTSGLQNASLAANAAAAGLPANFFQANPAINQSGSYLYMNGGNVKYNAIQMDFRRRMSQGLLVQASYVGVFSAQTNTWRTLRENWQYIDTTGGPKQAIKFNWVYELPFGRGKAFGSNASRWVDAVIGGWEFDGVARIQSGQRFNIGGYRLVGMTEQDVQKMFKFYKREDSSGKTRIYMFPQDVINNSIIALSQASATSPTGYSGALPTGRYFAPANGPDCVQYLGGQCPGTSLARIITGPWFSKFDFSFVKRITVYKNMRVEARMDLYNVFDLVNFNPVGISTGTSLSGWEVTSAARDLNASQDAGGRITSFGLRFSW
jgi:Carboxypeptidase regulatory-like domain